MINTRVATIHDAQLIAELSRLTFYETFARQNTKENMELFMNDVFNTEALIREVHESGNIFLLASENDHILGYARINKTSSLPFPGNTDGIEIARFYAVKTAVGKGVGKSMMKECLKIAIEKNKKSIWLGVWEHNQRAILFYESWGFSKQGEHLFILGKDEQTDWLMKKAL